MAINGLEKKIGRLGRGGDAEGLWPIWGSKAQIPLATPSAAMNANVGLFKL
jgi:hypothetical protein